MFKITCAMLCLVSHAYGRRMQTFSAGFATERDSLSALLLALCPLPSSSSLAADSPLASPGLRPSVSAGSSDVGYLREGMSGSENLHAKSRGLFISPLASVSRRFRYRDAVGSADASVSEVDSSDWVTEPPIRIGHGFDIHRMAPHGDAEVGGPVVIGGVSFDDFESGIVAHSDGDVIYHAVVDAIFGALTLPDIGQFFPDTDPRWKGAASNVFMKEAWSQMDSRGYRIGNIDVTLIAQAPRMMDKNHPEAEPGKPYDHKVDMVGNIASLLRCPVGRVNVKARTHENVDAVGEKRAVSCHVVVVLEQAR